MQNLQNSSLIESARRALLAAQIRREQAQVQARVQPSLTRSAIEQATYNYDAAKAAIDQTNSALVPQKIASAQAGFDQAKASYDAADRDYTRQKDLLAKGFLSKSQADAAGEKYGVAKGQLDSARRKLDTIKSETDQDVRSAKARAQQAKAELDNANANKIQDKLKQQEVSAADAAVRQAKAALQVPAAGRYNDPIRQGDIVQARDRHRQQAAFQNAKTQLGYTTIVAPRAGIVTKKYVEEGSIVTAGKSSIAGSGAGVGIVDIADVSRMYALVNVDDGHRADRGRPGGRYYVRPIPTSSSVVR